MKQKNFMRVLLFTALAASFFIGCKKKTDDPPAPTKQELFSGKTSKTWQIQKLYMNDTLYVLSPQELQYTITYKADSTYMDSDGMGGKYLMDIAGAKLIETLTTGGTGKFTYNIETLNESILIMRLVDDGSGINPNTQYHYRAK
ncbi:MAG: hypothetical protein FJ347_09515 [Sphingomonadales bacterium]|nr:hypothetical protein [Sphingomonadales bacterium]